MENKGLKVYGYVRVSSELQVMKDNSIKLQIDYINDYCKREDWELVKIYEDLGVSGKIRSRNGLLELFDNLKKNNIKKEKMEVYNGKHCFGVYRRGKKLIKNVSEIKTLKIICDLRDDGVSYFKISDYLNDGGYKSKEKKKWYGSSVRSVYMNGMKEKFLYNC